MGTILEDLRVHNEWDVARENHITALTTTNAELVAEGERDDQLIANMLVEKQSLLARIAELEEQQTPEPDRAFPILFGAAIDNAQTSINALQALWGPIRMSREYEATKGVGSVDRYPWWSSVIRNVADPSDDNFKYLMFSVDNPWAETSSGSDRAQWQALLDSLPTKLPGIKGVISIGNEPNIEVAAEQRAAYAEAYQAAVEKLIDTFGYEPVPGWCWGISFSNFASWGQSRTEGERWLPRREEGLFAVSTHIYGKTEYTPVADMLGRTFLPAMERRPNWIWGVGETSAQEDSGNTKKAAWMKSCYEYVRDNGGSWYLPFDTNTGGSADVGTSSQTIAAVKACAEDAKNNDWIF